MIHNLLYINALDYRYYFYLLTFYKWKTDNAIQGRKPDVANVNILYLLKRIVFRLI